MSDCYAYSPELLDEVVALVEERLPKEACAALFGPKDAAGLVTRLVAIPNVHPDPRRSFAFDDGAHLLALVEAERRGESLRALLHAHPEGEAELSQHDLCALTHEGRPLFPGVELVVVATRAGKAHKARAFSWDEAGGRYTGRALALFAPPLRAPFRASAQKAAPAKRP